MFFYNIDRVICYNGSYASLILGISYAKPKERVFTRSCIPSENAYFEYEFIDRA